MSFRELPVVKPELLGLGSRLGESRIRDLVRRFYARMENDVLIGFFFAGKNIVEIADRQSEFLLRAMGLRPSYSGKAPADAHTALPPILSGHFDRRLVLLDQTLQAEGLSESDRQIWIGFENAFRDAIVGTP
jgi:truncated hemoglobin YjbI